MSKLKKILIIPHHPSYGMVKIRLIEFAKQLAGLYEVYLLDWSSAEGKYLFLKRAWSSLCDLFKSIRIYKSGEINIVNIPLLHSSVRVARFFNSFWLGKAIKMIDVDAVINGSCTMFSIPNDRKYRYIFDLADFPISIDSSLEREISSADQVTAVSESLAEFLCGKYKVKSAAVPNGTLVEEFRGIDRMEVDRIKRSVGLYDRWIIGYIGFIGEWVDLEFMVKVFREVKKEAAEAVLLIVGPDPQNIASKYADKDILVPGPAEIKDYAKCIDTAVLPTKKSDFQDMAFHIKLVEFTAARKIVVASPSTEVEKLKFPNILVRKMDIEEWKSALFSSRNLHWQPEWDQLVLPYAWDRIAEKYSKIIEGVCA